MAVSMDKQFCLAEVARLHRQSVEEIRADRTTAATELRDNYNDLLSNLKRHFPSDEIVQSAKHVHRRENSWGEHTNTYLSEIRNRTQRIAQSLDVDIDEQINSEESPHVSIENVQSANQSMTTEVHVQTQIDVGPWDGDTKEELREIVREYEAELESEQPDKSHLRQLLKKVEDRSPEIAANMGIMALEKVMTGILNL